MPSTARHCSLCRPFHCPASRTRRTRSFWVGISINCMSRAWMGLCECGLQERVGVLQATRGARPDQFVADMIAPTFRPGHLAEMAMDDGGRLLACDSRAD